MLAIKLLRVGASKHLERSSLTCLYVQRLNVCRIFHTGPEIHICVSLSFYNLKLCSVESWTQYHLLLECVDLLQSVCSRRCLCTIRYCISSATLAKHTESNGRRYIIRFSQLNS